MSLVRNPCARLHAGPRVSSPRLAVRPATVRCPPARCTSQSGRMVSNIVTLSCGLGAVQRIKCRFRNERVVSRSLAPHRGKQACVTPRSLTVVLQLGFGGLGRKGRPLWPLQCCAALGFLSADVSVT